MDHYTFRKFDLELDQRLKYNMKNVQQAYLFLKVEVYPYQYCYVYAGNKIIKFATNRADFMHLCGVGYQGKIQESIFCEI